MPENSRGKSLSCVYKYIISAKKEVSCKKRFMNSMSSLGIHYRCGLNQGFTKAHLSEYKLLSERRPPRSTFACLGYTCRIGKTTCAMTKTLAPECKWACLRNSKSIRRRAKMLHGLPAATNTLFFKCKYTLR